MSDKHGIDLPHIPDDLIHALEEKFPDRCPDPADDDRTIWIKAGMRRTVEYILDQHRRQKEADRDTGLDGLYLDGGV